MSIYSKILCKFNVKAIYFDAIYHADLHAGNILFIKKEVNSNHDNDDDVTLNNELKASLSQLQTKYDLSLLQYNTLTTRSNEQAEELQEVKNKVAELTKSLNSSNTEVHEV